MALLLKNCSRASAISRGGLKLARASPKLFWDSSGLIAALLSPNGNSPGRHLLKLGEANYVDMRLSSEVLSDCERLLRRIKPATVSQLAVDSCISLLCDNSSHHHEATVKSVMWR